MKQQPGLSGLSFFGANLLMGEELNERSRRILEAIVEDYIGTGEPIGSRAVTRRHQIGLSPATVRNVMADLEEMGYIVSPHTSAGRVPTDRGYRYYVDTLLQVGPLDPRERSRIEQTYRLDGLRVEERLAGSGQGPFRHFQLCRGGDGAPVQLDGLSPYRVS